MTQEQAIMMIQSGDAAKKLAERIGAEHVANYALVPGQWEAGATRGADTTNNWTVIALLKEAIEFNKTTGACRCDGARVTVGNDGSIFGYTPGCVHQCVGEDGLVWYWDVD